MQETATTYAHKTAEGGWRVGESRVSLDSVVIAYWEGRSPEAIAEDFPSLTTEQVYGAIAFYLRNKDEIDRHLAEQDSRWRELAAQSNSRNGPLLERLRRARQIPASE
jgi:uncharacterized protein (DUF433 family)